MPNFEFKVSTKTGNKIIDVVSDNIEAAKKIATRHGKIITYKRKFGLDLSFGMSSSERYTWMHRMASMVGSKVSSSDALRIMEKSFGGKISKASKEMRERIESGMTIPDAMEQDRKNFPAATTALVKAGIATGQTYTALKDAADFENKMTNVHKGSMKQVYQNIGSFLLAVGLMVATTEYFGPQVMDNPLFKNAKGVDVEWTRVAGHIATASAVILSVIFILFFLLATVIRQIFPNGIDRFILKVPFYKDLILAKQNYVTLYKLGLLIKSGVRIEEALKLTESDAPRGALKMDLNNALKAIRNGKGKEWPNAMTTLHPTDKAALSTSSDRTDVSRTLDMLASSYADLYLERIKTFAPTLGLIAAFYMTLASALLFGQTILPMLQLSANIN